MAFDPIMACEVLAFDSSSWEEMAIYFASDDDGMSVVGFAAEKGDEPEMDILESDVCKSIKNQIDLEASFFLRSATRFTDGTHDAETMYAVVTQQP